MSAALDAQASCNKHRFRFRMYFSFLESKGSAKKRSNASHRTRQGCSTRILKGQVKIQVAGKSRIRYESDAPFWNCSDSRAKNFQNLVCPVRCCMSFWVASDLVCPFLYVRFFRIGNKRRSRHARHHAMRAAHAISWAPCARPYTLLRHARRLRKEPVASGMWGKMPFWNT